MKIGILIKMNHNIEDEIEKAHSLGFTSCQICCWDLSLCTDENAAIINKTVSKCNMTISAFWCGWSGPKAWNFHEGPSTVGLVPEEYRHARIKELKEGSDFAKKIGTDNIVTHVGFLPEAPDAPGYESLVDDIKELAEYIKKNGQYFLFETGQETPVALRRIIDEIGTGNLGVNFDVANLILYGKANPLDAVEILADYILDIHAKDGCYPTDGKALGKQVPLGEGKVNFPEIIDKLIELGYNGPITIENEISDSEHIEIVNKARELLEKLLHRA